MKTKKAIIMLSLFVICAFLTIISFDSRRVGSYYPVFDTDGIRLYFAGGDKEILPGSSYLVFNWGTYIFFGLTCMLWGMFWNEYILPGLTKEYKSIRKGD